MFGSNDICATKQYEFRQKEGGMRFYSETYVPAFFKSGQCEHVDETVIDSQAVLRWRISPRKPFFLETAAMHNSQKEERKNAFTERSVLLKKNRGRCNIKTFNFCSFSIF